MDSTNEFNILNSATIPLGCVCSGAEGFFGKVREKPDNEFEIEPRVFPLVSDAIVGTAFIFKDSNSRNHVVSWSSEPQATCITTFVRDKKRKFRDIPLHKLNNSDLLTGDVPEEVCNSVHAFEAAPTNTTAKEVKLFMCSRLVVCPSCDGMFIKRVSKICPLRKLSDTTYVRRGFLAGTFKSFPLGAPVVDGRDKLVGIVTSYDDDKVTVLGSQELNRLLL